MFLTSVIAIFWYTFRQIRIYIRPGKFFFPDVKIFLKCRGSFFLLYCLYVLLMLQYFMSIFIKNFSQFIKVVYCIYAWFICRKKKENSLRFLQECNQWKSLELFHKVQAYNNFFYMPNPLMYVFDNLLKYLLFLWYKIKIIEKESIEVEWKILDMEDWN